MAWVKLDDSFPDHRKLAELGSYAPLCGWLYVCGLAYCNRQLTDGVIPKSHVKRLAGFDHLSIETGEIPGMASFGEDVDVKDVAALLVQAGLWEDAERNYQVHDYLLYQPSREAVLKEREQAAKRKERWQERRSERSKNAVQNTEGTPPERCENACPVPDPGTTPSKNDGVVARARVASLIRPRDLSAFFESPVFNIPQRWADAAVRKSNGRLDTSQLLAFSEWLASKVERERIDVQGLPNFLGWLDEELRGWRESRSTTGDDPRVTAHLAMVASLQRGEHDR